MAREGTVALPVVAGTAWQAGFLRGFRDPGEPGLAGARRPGHGRVAIDAARVGAPRAFRVEAASLGARIREFRRVEGVGDDARLLDVGQRGRRG